MADGLGDKPDPDFDEKERLFRRIRPDQIYEESRIHPSALEDITEKHPSCSFNRGKYSNPEDVFDPKYPDFSEIGFLVAGNLPAPVPHPSQQNLTYGFRLVHLPESSNYSHSEAQVTKNGTDATKLGSPDLRRHLREALADKMTVLSTFPNTEQDDDKDM